MMQLPDLTKADFFKPEVFRGALKGISCYAGFVKRQGGWQPFSLLINQPVPYGLRKQVAEALALTPDLARY